MVFVYGGLLGLVLVESWYRWISWQSRRFCVGRAELLTSSTYALVLGTRVRVGRSFNRYLLYRLQAALRLVQAGKAEKLILSGSHPAGLMDQPASMKAWCLENGIPADRILVDDRGSRTWQSLRHCREAGIRELIIVSQRFHNERAVFIARHMGMQVQALNAANGHGWVQYRLLCRERLARMRCLWDILFDRLQKI
ncbi:SanA/YdcF family protein [Thermoflavifilum thermophilum]|nr:ElyC/SanA/YdcF family protein [Thermoflavifilum thermophilum]